MYSSFVLFFKFALSFPRDIVSGVTYFVAAEGALVSSYLVPGPSASELDKSLVITAQSGATYKLYHGEATAYLNHYSLLLNGEVNMADTTSLVTALRDVWVKEAGERHLGYLGGGEGSVWPIHYSLQLALCIKRNLRHILVNTSSASSRISVITLLSVFQTQTGSPLRSQKWNRTWLNMGTSHNIPIGAYNILSV